MVLVSIVQDIGADRGFLLSEKGFQSGAIRVAANTNITLTSIDDLTTNGGEQFVEHTLAKLSWRLTQVREQLKNIRNTSEGLDRPVFEQLDSLYWLDMALSSASKREYDTFYKIVDDFVYCAGNFEELVRGIDSVLSDAERWAALLCSPYGTALDTREI